MAAAVSGDLALFSTVIRAVDARIGQRPAVREKYITLRNCCFTT